MKLFISVAFIIINLQATPIAKTIDELMQEQDAPKISLYDPFKKVAPLLKKKSKKTRLKKVIRPELLAVLNNKAFINGKWYAIGDKALGQRLIKITPKAVYLKKGTKTKVLTLHKNNKSMFEITRKEKR